MAGLGVAQTLEKAEVEAYVGRNDPSPLSLVPVTPALTLFSHSAFSTSGKLT